MYELLGPVLWVRIRQAGIELGWAHILYFTVYVFPIEFTWCLTVSSIELKPKCKHWMTWKLNFYNTESDLFDLCTLSGLLVMYIYIARMLFTKCDRNLTGLSSSLCVFEFLCMTNRGLRLQGMSGIKSAKWSRENK